MNDMPNILWRTWSYAPSLQGSLEIKDRIAQPMAENLLVFEITEWNEFAVSFLNSLLGLRTRPSRTLYERLDIEVHGGQTSQCLWFLGTICFAQVPSLRNTLLLGCCTNTFWSTVPAAPRQIQGSYYLAEVTGLLDLNFSMLLVGKTAESRCCQPEWISHKRYGSIQPLQ